jgi:hypothetical protein
LARTLGAAQPVDSTILEWDGTADMDSLATPRMLPPGRRHFKHAEKDRRAGNDSYSGEQHPHMRAVFSAGQSGLGDEPLAIGVAILDHGPHERTSVNLNHMYRILLRMAIPPHQMRRSISSRGAWIVKGGQETEE